VLWLFLVLPFLILSAPVAFKNREEPIFRVFLFGLAFYVGIAVIYGGAIPRYASPGLFFLYPAAGYLITIAGKGAVGMAAQVLRFRVFLLMLMLSYYLIPLFIR
jgi:hypothetical protein